MMRTAVWCLATLATVGIAGFVFGGFYDLSATRQHPWWVYRGLVIMRETLVGLHSRSIELPEGFAPAADAQGAALYQAHCAACHGGPGEAPQDFALGMMPVAPPLVEVAREQPPAEIYWFIRYGLKMSGMPAWDLRMSEGDMWRVTAFVEALPTLSPREYASLVESSGGPAESVTPVREPARADPERGRVAMQVHACRSCHLIPGMAGPDAHVGPDLAAAGARRYIAGVLPNTPENMVRWITDPQGVDPLTAMPDLGVSEGAARDIAAYLYQVAPEPPPAPAREEEGALQAAASD